MGRHSEFYTTGVWASAAAKAAVLSLLSGSVVHQVEVLIPLGKRVSLPVESCLLGDGACAKVVKLSPEAEDVTHKAVITAKATCCKEGVILEGGRGIGTITKPGLKLPVGEKAINPVPRCFILKNIAEVFEAFGYQGGVRVVLEVEEGEKIAERTINSKLGIVGGISILGTRGTVIPYSTKSFMDSILAELSVARAQGLAEIVFAPGRESVEYAKKILHLPQEAFITIGDFVYFAVKHASRMGFERIIFVAQPAKMAKVAYGFKNTHARYGSLPMDWLARVLGVNDVAKCNTVREATQLPGSRERWVLVEELAKKQIEQWTGKRALTYTVWLT